MPVKRRVRLKNVLADYREQARSRVTNGREVLPGVNPRSQLARRYRDILSLIVADLGGSERLSEAKRQLIRRFAATSVMAEQMEARMANGEDIDVDEHVSLSASLVRLAVKIGLNRHTKALPNMEEYLRIKADRKKAARLQTIDPYD